MPRLLFPPRNPLAFPTGRAPGVDPTHPAAQNLQASCIAVGTRFLRIDRPKISTFAGTTSVALVDSALGPSVRCATTFGAGGELHSFTVAGGAAGSPGTLACICRPATTGGNLGVLIAADTPGNAINYFYSNNLVLGNSRGGASSITLTGDDPYFLAWTWPGGATTEYLVAANLRTGKVQLASQTSSASGASSVMAVMNAANQAAGMGGPLAAGMFAVKFLAKSQLLAWAADPWSFWYPPTNREINQVGTTVAPPAAGVSIGIPPGYLFSPGLRSGPTHGLRSTLAFPPDTITPPEGIPAGTIFVPSRGPTRGLRPTQAFPPVTNQNYTLPIGPGSYAVTGATIGLGDALPVEAGTYAYAGAAITLGVGLNISAGTYAYSGATTTLGTSLNVGAGSYAYAGQGPTLGTDYVYRGFPVTLTYVPSGGATYTLAIAAGAYTYTGSAITLAVGMSVAAGSYAYTGAAVTLGAGISISAGSYAYTGAAIHFALGRTVGAGAYNVTGVPLGLGAGINIGAGTYNYTGLPITLSVGMGVGSGAYVYTGLPVGTGAGLNVGAGAYAYTGAAVRLDVGMGVGKGTYVYTGFDVQLIYTPIGPANYVLSIGAGSYVYNGLSVGLVYVPAGGIPPSFGVGGKNVACNYGVSGQGAVFGFSNPVNPFATVVLETDR